MYSHIVPHRGEGLRLFDYGVWVLVTQQYEGNFCHSGNRLPYFRPIVYVDSADRAFNKPAFLRILKAERRKKTTTVRFRRRQRWDFQEPG
jgi:hypothetical protein